MRTRTLIAALVLSVTAQASSQAVPPPLRLSFFFQKGDSAAAFLLTTGSVQKSGDLYLVRGDFSPDALGKVLSYYRTCIEVAMENIRNQNTTRTPEGGAYRRRVVPMDSTGSVSIVPLPNDHPRLVYDPSHPDAARSGPRAGYVEYPSIRVDQELDDLRYYAGAFNTFVGLGEALGARLVAERVSYSDLLGQVRGRPVSPLSGLTASLNLADVRTFDQAFRYHSESLRNRRELTTVYQRGGQWYGSTTTWRDNGTATLFREDSPASRNWTVTTVVKGLDEATVLAFLKVWYAVQGRIPAGYENKVQGLDGETLSFEFASGASAGWYQFWVDETDPYAPAFQELRNAFEQLKP